MRHNLRNALFLLVLGIATCGAAFAEQPSSSAPALDTPEAKASYALGATVGRNLRRDGVEIDAAIFLRGLRDGLSGGKLLVSDEEAKAALTKLQQDARARRETLLKEESAENKKKGEAFLAANKTKEGVVTLPSGLQYKVLKKGSGPTPTLEDTVVCNYRGTLIDGTEFDSSYKRGKPATFPVRGVIQGWTEILQQMPVGSQYQVYIPSDLAYGERGPGSIGPNSALIFDIELLSIQEQPAPGKMPAGHPKSPH
jgi:FKBP-type peptidyl-prolyl cis-trans isomerase FklB